MLTRHYLKYKYIHQSETMFYYHYLLLYFNFASENFQLKKVHFSCAILGPKFETKYLRKGRRFMVKQNTH